MMTKLQKILAEVESKVGIFSTYAVMESKQGDEPVILADACTIPFAKKPAQQMLRALHCSEMPLTALTTRETKYQKEKDNSDVSIQDFTGSSQKIMITGERIDRLFQSAKVYINQDIFPGDEYKNIIRTMTLVDYHDMRCQTARYLFYWQNMAVGVCHAQEVDILVEQALYDIDLEVTVVDSDGNIIDEEKKLVNACAVAKARNGMIKKDDPALLMLSSPVLDFRIKDGEVCLQSGHAISLRPEDRLKFIKGMYRNLFQTTIDEHREYIVIPGGEFDVFKGDPCDYFNMLMEVAIEYPQLQIIYHPGINNQEAFKKQLGEKHQVEQLTNLALATKDPLFIADQLIRSGYSCALHNPSEASVVYGLYDVGECWKWANADHYLGEEHIGSMTTAPLNSKGVNPEAYERVFARFLPPQVEPTVDPAQIESHSQRGGLSMTVLGGFIAVLGVSAVAVAFVALNIVTLGLPGFVLAGIGVAAVLAGVGLFSKGVYQTCKNTDASNIPVQTEVSNF